MLKFREEKFTVVWSLRRLTVQSQPSLTRHFQIKKQATARQPTSLEVDEEKIEKTRESSIFKSHAQEQEREEDL